MSVAERKTFIWRCDYCGAVEVIVTTGIKSAPDGWRLLEVGEPDRIGFRRSVDVCALCGEGATPSKSGVA